MANEVEVLLTIEEQQALRAISKVIKATDKLGDEAKKTGKKTDAFFGSFTGNLAAIASSKAFTSIISGIKDTVKAAGELEVFETQFKTILGSTKAAQDQLRELQEFAASTPFQLPGLALSTRQLLSFGVAQKDIIPTLQQLGDLAAGTGANIDELTIPFGRLISTQKLTLVELDKFADRGINLYQKLADQTGASVKNIRDDISKGKIPFEEFTQAIGDLTSEGGIFFNGMQAQSQTLSGVLSTLSDNFFNLQGEIGNAFKPAIVQAATEITSILKTFSEVMAANGPSLSKTFSEMTNMLLITPTKFWLDFFAGDSVGSVSAMETELAKVNEQIRLTELELNKATDATGFTKFLVDITGSTEGVQSRLGELIFQASNLKREIDKATKTDTEDEATTDPKQDPRVVKERAVFDEIGAIRSEQRLVEQENILKEKEAKGLASETELEELKTFEMQKLELKRANELEKASFIQDADKRLKTQAAINAKADLDLEKSRGKASVALAKTIADAKISGQKSTFDTIATLSSSSNSTLAAIGKAAAITQIAIQTPIAVSKALAAFPPPFNFAAAGLVGTAMAVQAAKVAGISGFANGGVVGGFQGATSGSDNQVATVRSGEMFLNAPQQRQLFDVANGSQSGGNNEAVMAALSQPIIIQIDNKEIARANRTAIQEGFAA